MKVCVLSSGVVHAVPRTLAFAAGLGDVHFVDLPGTADRNLLESHGVVYHRLDDQGFSRFASRNLQALLRQIGPDVIVCHYAFGDHFFSAVAYGRCPVAVIAMGTDILHERGVTRVSPIRGLLARMALRRVAFVSAKSSILAARIRSYGVTCPMEVNFWGTDLAFFCPGDQLASRKRLGLPAGRPVILSPRAVDPTYNIDRIIAAFAELRKAFPMAVLVNVGRATSPYLQRVQEQADSLKLGDSVLWPGVVDASTLRDYYRASDVVVSMASTEGFPNTLLEAMSCAVPIVAGRLPQLEELLTDGVSARLCPMDVHAIAGAIRETLMAPAPAAALAERAREIAIEHGDLTVNGARFAATLRSALAAPPRRSTLSTGIYRAVYLASRLGDRG